MHILALLFGCFFPWFVGYTILRSLLPRQHSEGNHAVVAGYGFFVGYACLYFILQWQIGDGSPASYGLTIGCLGLLAIVFAGLWYYRHKTFSLTSQTNDAGGFWSASPLTHKVLFLVLLLWMLLHIGFSLLEVITQPLFPWDAWSIWVFRAKAWFLSQHVSETVLSLQWIRADSPLVYTSAAPSYPWFASLVPYWAAVSLGEWHEALINLPAFFCGLALAIGFYGQCRSYGLGLLIATIFAYLIVSTPLAGTHLSIAGYADIWMAGFVGLGFVALLRGHMTAVPSQTLLGAFMVCMGYFIKWEGTAWLLVAFVWLVIIRIPVKWLVIGAAVAGAMLLLAVVTGLTYFELPLIGPVGWRGGFLFIPLFGQFQFQVHDVRAAYFDSSFRYGSWNLLWLFVMGSVIALGLKRNYQQSAPLFWFVGLFVATQVTIFVFTNEGIWASNFTALNRLPLHFWPAMVFVVAVTVSLFSDQRATELPGEESNV